MTRASTPSPDPWPDPDGLPDLDAATPSIAHILRQAAGVRPSVLELMRTLPVGNPRRGMAHLEIDHAWAWAAHTHRRVIIYPVIDEAFDVARQHGWTPLVDSSTTAAPAWTLYQALLAAAVHDLTPSLAKRLRRRWDDAMPPSHLTAPALIDLWCQLRRTSDRAAATATVDATLAAIRTPPAT